MARVVLRTLLREGPTPKRTPKAPRQAPALLDPAARQAGCEEVALGLTAEQAPLEAARCLDCKDPKCVAACPLHIDIKSFIARLLDGDPAGAFEKISESSPFPGICGRVCQHELYCEKACLLGTKLDPVAIGSLERYVADVHRAETALPPVSAPLRGPRVALAGSGPSSLMAAFDLARAGYRPTIFEALHDLGGVLAYGIPPFRLPREILREELDRLRAMGVEFHSNVIVGRTCTVQDLFDQGFRAVFVGTGAGLPHLLDIPGENLAGVYTANEFLTRLNLMRAWEFPLTATPVRVGSRTIVVGGGNSAIDAARWARRMGSDACVLFRRGRAEMRARLEEIEHAEAEGVRFEFLAAPVRLTGNDEGQVTGMECIRMRLGEADESGRPAPVPIEESEFLVSADTVVAAIGQSPNPTLQRSTPELLTRHGKIVIDGNSETSLPGVYAGGDVVRGGSTVILALRDGRAAAAAIDRALRNGGGECQSAAPAPSAGRILARRRLAPDVVRFEIDAPQIARAAKPGQFVIVRPVEDGERVPLTIVDADPALGAITLVVQAVGLTTRLIASRVPGDVFEDVAGPLGEPVTIAAVGRVVCVAGGVGVAELLPVARALRAAGNQVTALCGARTARLRILDRELREACDEVLWATDDGSAGLLGNVVNLMTAWRGQNPAPARVHVIGPIPMMRAAAALTGLWNVPTFASLNPIMVDGTGMCGGCRVTVGGRVRFACVDGPEFNAHEVDFEELARRNLTYRAQELVGANSPAAPAAAGQEAVTC